MSGVTPTTNPIQPDYTTAPDAATYKARLDGAALMARRAALAFAPHAQSTPDMTVRLEAGALLVGGVRTEVAAQSTSTITAPSVNPRIDLVHVDMTTGAVGVTTGSESATPSAPACPAGTFPVALVALETTSTEIADTEITDVRCLVRGTLEADDITDLGTAALLDVGVNEGNIPVVESGGKLPTSVLPSVGLPVGAVIAWDDETPPEGFLERDGSAISRVAYAALFAHLGVRYGDGDGSATFNLPDNRGDFLRGWDNGRGADPDAAVRTDRGDGTTGDHVGTNQGDAVGDHAHDTYYYLAVGSGELGQYMLPMTVADNRISAFVSQSNGKFFFKGGCDAESRPRNGGVMWCIKY